MQYNPETLKRFAHALWDDGGTLTKASLDGLCYYAEGWGMDLIALEDLATENRALRQRLVQMERALADRDRRIDEGDAIPASFYKRLEAAENYIVALYDGNNDRVDSAFEDLPADMQERLRKADEKVRAKHERKTKAATP